LIDTAVNTVAEDRGTIGATVNQLTASQTVDSAAVTNLTSAEDSIQNADVGQVVAQMTQNNVLEQTGMAALSQSNQMQQNVLNLDHRTAASVMAPPRPFCRQLESEP
jgi:flagellin